MNVDLLIVNFMKSYSLRIDHVGIDRMCTHLRHYMKEVNPTAQARKNSDLPGFVE